MNAIRFALSSHDVESPLSAEELRALACEMEDVLIDNECNFSHPDWRYVDGLRALARLQKVTKTATTPEVKREVKRAK